MLHVFVLEQETKLEGHRMHESMIFLNLENALSQANYRMKKGKFEPLEDISSDKDKTHFSSYGYDEEGRFTRFTVTLEKVY